MDLSPRTSRLLNTCLQLEQQLSTPWRLDDLARNASYSATHFERVFAELTGHTPIDYLQQRRLLRAALRTRHENTPLLQIAHETGFSSDSVFSRNFRKAFGFAPRDWRKGAWLEFHLDIQARWRRLHQSDPQGTSDESLMASLEACKPDIALSARVRFCPRLPIWCTRRFGLWGRYAAEYGQILKNTLPSGERPPLWCAITREDPGFITGEQGFAEWAVLATGAPPEGWLVDKMPAGYYLCLAYRGAGAQFRWLYSDWLECQQRWIPDASRPHLHLFRNNGAIEHGELRLPVRLA
ncbi:AraC family transcriptional regulator [Chitinibacter bivalviorum]|uniref:AraC family transcriptional regulator n=1 Tax=Chitinibacter bivalviorum TaxID=2739434 RepID=A0A7H9BNP7_9NEIS|nr:AraC family transcriptional regulator [Chitinibacter bivalviorum]QLG88954.1 AraC family transcriptional regulator [Chitinibacter bivalviorum]